MRKCYIAYQHGAAIDGNHMVVKIGFSANVLFRFEELQAMSWIGPHFLEATTNQTSADGSEIERFMHAQLSAYRIHHEWFHLPKDALELAKTDVFRRFGEAFMEVPTDSAIPMETTA